jgi:RimJ/RimL family protein N-acetyltransferase
MTQTSLFHGRLVRLAAPVPEDAEIFAAWEADTDFLRQLDTDYVRPRNRQDHEEMLREMRQGGLLFHIHTLDNDRMIGFVALFHIEWNNQIATISVGIGESDYRGKGYGSEAIQLALNYAFNELNLHRVGLDVIGDNRRAIRAYEKLGFQYEGAMRQAVHRDGKRVDRVIMGLLREEWQAIHSPALKEESC